MILNKNENNFSYLKTCIDLNKNEDTNVNPIVFIHGASFNKDSWSTIIPFFSGSYTCFAPDLPGHGEAPGKGYDRISGYSHFILDFIRTMGLKKPVVCGSSMGGAIVQDLLTTYDSEFSAGILMNTGPFLTVSETIFNAVKKRYSAYVSMLVSFGTSGKSDRNKIESIIKKMSLCKQDVACRDFEACNNFSVINDLKSIKIPVLIIGGEDDKITPPGLSEIIHQNIIGSEIKILPDTGHFPSIEKPEITEHIVRKFLKNQNVFDSNSIQ